MEFNLNVFKKIIEVQNEINRTVRDEVDCDPGVKFVKIDIDKNTEVAAKLGVMSIPNMIVFKDGNIVNRQIGGLPKNELKAFIENCL